MEASWIAVTAVAFFGVGLGVGLLLLRHARAVAAGEARQAATQEVATLQQQLRTQEDQAADQRVQLAACRDRAAADQERFVRLTAEVTRAQTFAEQTNDLRSALDGAKKQIDLLQREVREALEQLAQSRTEHGAADRRVGQLSAELESARTRVERLEQNLRAMAEERTRVSAELEAERKAALERAALAESAREQVRAEIEVLAHRLLDEKGKVMLHQNREALDALLKPVADKLREFEAKVDKTYDQENRDRASLLSSLQKLQETQAKLHQEAESLSRALTGESKAQGDWGELVLERVLETAGLTEGREYDLQVNHVDDEGGRKRPDALVYLPANRVVVVDAKCSLTAFSAAMRQETEEGRQAALDAHVASVRAHVKGLASKSYQDVVKERTLDIVLLFIPSEAAFHAAIARDVGLYDEAFRQRVVLCSPTTLLAALQLISHVWRSEKQNQNAQKIAEEAGKLLDKLSAFVGDLDEVGMRLTQAQESFGAARNKLATGRGNVLRKAAELARLGARVRPDKLQPLLVESGGEGEEAAEVLALPAGPREGRGGGPATG